MPASQIPIPPIPYFTHEFCTFLTKKKRHGSFLEFGISISFFPILFLIN
jgi:hypothetical protein